MSSRSTHRISGGLDGPLRARELALGVLAAKTDGRPGLVEDLRLLVSELATNSLLHGGVAEDGEFILAIEVNDVIRIEVIDQGSGFQPGTRLPHPDAGGYGLKLVDRIAQRWGVDLDKKGSTHVWFELEPSAYAA
ncbi:MAG: ATP-binding protein [Solirubrobacteraceae bacterium]